MQYKIALQSYGMQAHFVGKNLFKVTNRLQYLMR